MAFPAKDGTMHTNADSMRTRNAMASAPAPAQAEGDQHNLGEAKQEFDGILAAIQGGQSPDPEAVKSLIEFLEQFTSGEGEGESEQGESEPWGGGQ